MPRSNSSSASTKNYRIAEYDGLPDFPYAFVFFATEQFDCIEGMYAFGYVMKEIEAWCEDQFGDRYTSSAKHWTAQNGIFSFVSITDATAFKVRWA